MLNKDTQSFELLYFSQELVSIDSILVSEQILGERVRSGLLSDLSFNNLKSSSLPLNPVSMVQNT